jgi:hypothetical protein
MPYPSLPDSVLIVKGKYRVVADGFFAESRMNVWISLRVGGALRADKTGNTRRVNELSVCMFFTSPKGGKKL